MSRSTPASFRGARLLIAAAAAALVAGLTLAPRSLVAPARGAFMESATALLDPVLSSVSYTQLEGALNALLFVPLGAALALVLPRRAWPAAPLLGAALSFAVESAQLRIPGRVPDLDDVLWNSAGALAGAVAVLLVRELVHLVRWSRRRGARRGR